MYQLMFSEAARSDRAEAFLKYERIRSSLGDNFDLCLESCLRTIERPPLIFQIKYADIRICNIDRFPYAIHFAIEENYIIIIGIFYSQGDPSKWFQRLD